MIAAFALTDEPEPGVLGEPEDVHAVHLTLLLPDGSGKAAVAPNKITIASPAGMPIVLAPMNDLMGLAITEGIEDALSVHAGHRPRRLGRRQRTVPAQARRRDRATVARLRDDLCRRRRRRPAPRP